ncbi:PREDICTED: uncharacterized protein LOC106819931 [Priapulus caudatus]|uniref:Uncharacterized protein LOC106819931 n=1 Tax=Priapulus caudatus TaxID=37621 RepID=A0ABM1F6B7_PRICU|nr:PREDICTED: uncharacterized protein LOC106819931 [Priapulus caudatus]
MLEAEPWIALMQERMADESAASGDTSATMSSKKESNVTSMNENQFMQEASKLLGIMQQQLQGTLMALVKAASTPAKRGKGPPDAELLKTYKSMYQCALRMEDKAELIITNLLQTLRQLNRLHVGTQSKARS